MIYRNNCIYNDIALNKHDNDSIFDNSDYAKLFSKIKLKIEEFDKLYSSNPEDPRLYEIIEYCNELKGQAAKLLITP